MPGVDQWPRDRKRVLAAWQDGLTTGLLSAAEIADQQGHHQLARDIRDTTIRYVTEVAQPLDIDLYETA